MARLATKEMKMNYRNKIVPVLMLALAAAFVSSANASSSDTEGFDIAARSDRSDVGFGDS